MTIWLVVALTALCAIGYFCEGYNEDELQHFHAAWLVGQGWGRGPAVKAIDGELAGKPGAERGWYVNREGQTLALQEFPDDPVAFSPDGLRLAHVESCVNVALCDASSGETQVTLKKPSGPVVAIHVREE